MGVDLERLGESLSVPRVVQAESNTSGAPVTLVMRVDNDRLHRQRDRHLRVGGEYR